MADKHELTEEQFKLLKAMCEQEVYVMLSPELMPEDTPKMVENRNKNKAMIDGLIAAGFATDVTEKFSKVREQCKEDGVRLFEVFMLTEAAVRMFTPMEGGVN